ncbi:hypothetical protein LBMAG52_19570 [Planctomycetia bacterium]|nr:hypothetical protein LBMAG52_19570 [Planctomycetia bacterium]
MEDLGIDEKYPRSEHVRSLEDVAGSYTYFAEGDVLLAKITPCFQNGKLGIAKNLKNGVGFGSSEFIVIRPSAELDREYVYYFLSREDFLAEGVLRMGGSVGQQRVPNEFVQGQLIPLPPLAEQRRIVGILDEAFEGLATAKANAEQNLQNARALFESHLQAVFTQRGDGWVEHTLGDACEFVGGSQPPKSVFTKKKTADNVRLIQIRDYKSDKHVVFIPRSQARRFCTADDVMIGRYGPPLFQILRGIDGAYNVALMKAVPNETKVSKDFLFYFLKHSAILQYVIFHAQRAAGQIGVTKDTLEPYPIALPPLAAQTKVVKTIVELESAIESLESLYQRKLAALDELKKSLLHRAFSGQL